MTVAGGNISKYFTLLLVVAFSCSEDEKIDQPPEAKIVYSDGIDRILLDASSSSDPERKPLTFEWSTSSGDITLSRNEFATNFFKIPPGNTETSVEVTLKVSDSKTESETSIIIPIPALTQTRSFGLGANLTGEADNSATYSWYLDQANSGPYAPVNCGPASVTMATKWAKENFNGSIEDARNTYRSGGGWWYTNDIINYLNINQVSNWTVSLTNSAVLKEAIDNDHIIILCLDMFYVRASTEAEHRVNKFYLTEGAGWGHFIVVKGYKEVDGQLFFETYDPYSWGNEYKDQTLKGMNRYYRAVDLDIATQIWWDYAIIVSKGSQSGKRNAVDVNTIIHKPGR